MKQYTIIRRQKIDELIDAVNAYMTQQAWEPIGGVACMPAIGEHDHPILMQAMQRDDGTGELLKFGTHV